MNTEVVNCEVCNSSLIEMTTLVRKRVGCAANCSGKMVKMVVGYKCVNCGHVVKV